MFLGMSAVVALEAQHRVNLEHRHCDDVVGLVRYFEVLYGRSPDAVRQIAEQVRQYQLAALGDVLQQDLADVYADAFRAFLRQADYEWLVSGILDIPYQPRTFDMTPINHALAVAADRNKTALAYHIRRLAKKHGRMNSGYDAIVAELIRLHRTLMESVCADDQFGLRPYLPALLALVDSVGWLDIVGSVLGDPVDSFSRYMERIMSADRASANDYELSCEYADAENTAEYGHG